MRHIIYFCFLFTVSTFPLFSQQHQEFALSAEKAERMQWWSEARFGMFIH